MNIVEYAKMRKMFGGGSGGDIDALIDGSLTEIKSNVESVMSHALSNNKNITSVSLPSAKEIGDSAFFQCSSLTSVNAPLATEVGYQTFYYCQKLANVNLPLLRKMGDSAFGECDALTSVTFPLLEKISMQGFNGCGGLKSVNFPSVNEIGYNAFFNCVNIITADFSSSVNIGSYGFKNCGRLKALILRSSTVSTLSSTNAFDYCYHILGTVNAYSNPDGLKDGYIYVPRALIDSYKAATNWTTFATQFRALEDYTVDGTTTGELDESKVNA